MSFARPISKNFFGSAFDIEILRTIIVDLENFKAKRHHLSNDSQIIEAFRENVKIFKQKKIRNF